MFAKSLIDFEDFIFKKSQKSQKNSFRATKNFSSREIFENFSSFKNDIIFVEATNVLLYKVPSRIIYQGLNPPIITSIQLKPINSWGG